MPLAKRAGSLIAVVDGSTIRIQNEEGWKVLELSTRVTQGLADDIARALLQARDIGYAQAQADIREALGMSRQ